MEPGSLTALAGSLVSLILLAVKLWSGHEDRERKKARALSNIEKEEARASMDRVDALYDADDRLQSGGASVPLPSGTRVHGDGAPGQQ